MGQRFEPSGENFEFVQGRSSLPRNPGVFTTPPLDPVAGDILVDQNGESTTLYVSVNQETQPYARTGEFRPQTWVPVQASVGSDPVASYGVRLWEEDVAYEYSDVVLVSDGNGGFLMWLALAGHLDTEPAPQPGASNGWALVGSAAGAGGSPVTEAPEEPPTLQAGFFWWDTDAENTPTPGGGASTVEYLYGGDVTGVDPGAGNIRISGTGNQTRVLAISEIDADGQTRNYGVLKAGDTVVITDDPDAPPISGFVRYLLIADPVDEGAWWSAQALRTDTTGSTAPPPIGTRLRVTAHLTDGGGGGSASEPVDAVVAQSWRSSNDWPVPAVATTIPFEQVLNTDATVVEAAATGLFTIRQAGTYLVNVDLNIASTPMPVTAFAILTGFVDPANGAEFVAAQQIDSSQAERSQMTLTFPIVLSAAQVPATVRIAADSNGTGVVVRGSAANRRSQASIIRLSGLKGDPGDGDPVTFTSGEVIVAGINGPDPAITNTTQILNLARTTQLDADTFAISGGHVLIKRPGTYLVTASLLVLGTEHTGGAYLICDSQVSTNGGTSWGTPVVFRHPHRGTWSTAEFGANPIQLGDDISDANPARIRIRVTDSVAGGGRSLGAGDVAVRVVRLEREISGAKGEPGSGGDGDFVLRSGDTMTGPLVMPQLRTNSAGVVVPSQQGIGIADDTSWIKFRSGAGIGIWLRDPAGSIFHTAPGHIWQEQGGVQLMSLVWDRLTLQSNTIDVPYGFRIANLSSARADILRNTWDPIPGTGDAVALTAAGGSGASVILAPAGVTAAQRIIIGTGGVMSLEGLQLRTTQSRPEFTTWDSAMILSNGQGLGNSIAMHVPGLAPQIRVSQSRGEIIDFVNSASNAFISIGALGFNTGSARRTKRNIAPLVAERALRIARDVQPVTYLPAVRPQTLRLDPVKVDALRAEFMEEQRRHYAGLVDDEGNPVPVPKGLVEPDYSTDPRALTGHDHDCAIDGCGEQCVIATNDHERISFIAEELADVLPEAVYVDADGPSGYDVGQVAVVALAAVGELTRMVEALTARVAELERLNQ